MGLPLPGFGTTLDINFNANPVNVLVVATVGPDTFFINWDQQTVGDQQKIIDLVGRYGGTIPFAAGKPGFHVVDYGGSIVGAAATGFVAGDSLEIVVEVDGVESILTIAGASATTFTTMVAALSTALTGASAAIVGGNIVVTSALIPITLGAGSSVNVRIRVGQLFQNAPGFVGFEPPVPGALNFAEALELNDSVVAISSVGTKPAIGPAPQNTGLTYFDGVAWKRLVDDALI